eukprot:7114411-Pyramimonas_sp.AAC.1
MRRRRQDGMRVPHELPPKGGYAQASPGPRPWVWCAQRASEGGPAPIQKLRADLRGIMSMPRV